MKPFVIKQRIPTIGLYATSAYFKHIWKTVKINQNTQNGMVSVTKHSIKQNIT